MERLVEQDPWIGQLRKGEQSFFRTPGNLASYRMLERAETDYRNAFKNAKARVEAKGEAPGYGFGCAADVDHEFYPRTDIPGNGVVA